jgi:serine/threonine protein kinase
LAVILYEVLTGKLPFSARTPMEYIQKHVMEQPIPLNQRVEDKTFPASLEAVVNKALSKEPVDRYQTAAEFAEALKHSLESDTATPPISEVQPSTPQPAVVEPPTPGAPPARVAEPAPSAPGTGLLLGVAAGCLLVGVILAGIIMRYVLP